MSILGSLTNSLGLTGTSQSTNTAGLSPQDALELKVKDAYYRMQLEKQVSNVSLGAFSQLPPIVTDPPIKLDEGAWDIPVSQLVDLWIVRYGSKWVDESELDEFYKVASRRLRTLNKIESHFVNGKDVFKIVE